MPFPNGKGTKLLLLPIPLLSIILYLSIPNPLKSTPKSPNLHFHSHLQIAHSTCQGTLYPDLCISTLAAIPDLPSKSIPELIAATINQTMSEVKASSKNCSKIEKTENLDIREQRAVDDCLELLSDTMSDLQATLSDLSDRKTVAQNHDDLETIFSAAMTNQYTCLDGFAYSKGDVRGIIQKGIFNISRHVSNSLVMLNKVPGVNKTAVSEVFPAKVKRGFPAWMKSRERKLLQTALNATKFDLIVAKDGTGNFTNITDAVAAAPNNSDTRFVIYIKAGAYFENVEVVKKQRNLMFVGDGIGKTVIKASRNVVDGWTTFRSATVAVVGTGFIAKGITIENSAGPSKHQAVALRSGADFSAFYQCSFVGYQDTLYTHSLRQFYRECDIYGTVDFIFGNAAVVLQKCNMYARKPNPNQKNMFTAQGREDPNQNTGISIMNSKMAAAADLIPVKSTFKTYLGRPWKEYSRTVILNTLIDDSVEPAGWLEWNGTFALSTLYYGEYMNRGPGANTSARVTWPGYRVINSSVEANLFTVGPFIQGDEWINSTIVPYFLNLTGS